MMKRIVMTFSLLVATTSVLSLNASEPPLEKSTSHERSYHVVADFPKSLLDITLDATSAVASDSKGDILIFHRGKPPILVCDPAGNLLRSFGDGLFKSAHGLRVDADDNIWVTDNANHTVIKFSPMGDILMSLGTKDVPGEDASHFDKPTDVAFDTNGNVYIADGYGNSRIVKFNKSGEFITTWGRKGKGDGEFDLPHAIQVDAKGQVYVGDRENDRIQVFDADGKYLRQFGGMAPYGMYITPDQELYVADGRANKILMMTLDGKILTSWGTSGAEPGNFQMPHGLTVAADGAVYVTEITGKRIQKFVTGN